MSLKNRAGSCGCCGCSESTITWTAVIPDPEDTVELLGSVIAFERKVFPWAVSTFSPRVSEYNGFINRIQLTFTLGDPAFFDFSTITAARLQFRYRGFDSNFGANRAFKIVGPVVSASVPADGEELETVLEGAGERPISNAEMSGALLTIKNIDFTANFLAVVDNLEADYVLGLFESTASSGTLMDQIKIQVSTGGDFFDVSSAQVLYRKQVTTVTTKSTSAAWVGNFEGSTFHSAIRFALNANAERKMSEISNAVLRATFGTIGVDPHAFTIVGTKINSPLPSSRDQLLAWMSDGTYSIDRASDSSPVHDTTITAMLADVEDDTESIVLFLRPTNDLDGGISLSGPYLRYLAPLPLILDVSSEVFYDTAAGHWEIKDNLAKDYWTVAITPCGVSGTKNPYIQKWVYDFLADDVGEELLLRVSLTLQERAVGDFQPPEYPYSKSNHWQVIVERGLVSFESVFHTLGIIKNNPLQITSRPSGVLLTASDFFPYNGEWASGVPAQLYDSVFDSRDVYMPPLGNDVPVKIRISTLQLEPIDPLFPLIPSGSFTLSRSRVSESDVRQECPSPMGCSVKDPDFATARWESDTVTGELDMTDYGWSYVYQYCESAHFAFRTQSYLDLELQNLRDGIRFGSYVGDFYSDLEANSFEAYENGFAMTDGGGSLEFGEIRPEYLKIQVSTPDAPAYGYEDLSLTHYKVTATLKVLVFAMDGITHENTSESFGFLDLSNTASFNWVVGTGDAGDRKLFPIYSSPATYNPDGSFNLTSGGFFVPPDTPLTYQEFDEFGFPIGDPSPLYGVASPNPFSYMEPVFFTYVWTRLVPKWLGAPPELTFSATDSDCVNDVRDDFRVSGTSLRVFYKQEYLAGEWTFETFGGVTQPYYKVKDRYHFKTIDLENLSIPVVPATDSMPHPPEPAP